MTSLIGLFIFKNLAAPRTPPPSYSILISNGDSLFTPPSYRMLFPLESNISSSFEGIFPVLSKKGMIKPGPF